MAHFEWMTVENPKDGVIPKVLDRCCVIFSAVCTMPAPIRISLAKGFRSKALIRLILRPNHYKH